MTKSRVASLIASAGALGAAILLAATPAPTEATNSGAGRRVRVATVEQGRLARLVGFPATTRAADRADVAFLVGGRLLARPVEVGDVVKAGQVLARLDPSELGNGLDMARADLARAESSRAMLERDTERVTTLHAARAATTEELEKTSSGLASARAAEAAARAALAEAQRRSGEGVLRAPWAGTVVAVNAEPGENVAPGRRIVTLSGSGALEVEIQVPESVASELTDGAEVVIRFPSSRREPITGRIERVSRDTFGAGALFPVTVALPKRDDIVAGLSVRAELDLGVDNTLLVPVAAVVDPGGQRPTVYRIVDGRAERLEIDVHGLEGARVAVTGALVAGDRVVVGGQRGLLQGELVEVVP